MNLDGSEKVELTTGVQSFVVKGDWIYRSYKEQMNYGIFKTRTDSSNKTKLSDDYASEIYLVNDYI